MIRSHKTRRHGLALLGVSLLLLTPGWHPANATPAYTVAASAPSSVALPHEMNSYDPAVLSISFRRNPEIPLSEPESIPDNEALFSALQQQAVENVPSEARPASRATAAVTPPTVPISTPEPGTLTLLGLGIIALLVHRRRNTRT